MDGTAQFWLVIFNYLIMIPFMFLHQHTLSNHFGLFKVMRPLLINHEMELVWKEEIPEELGYVV